MWTCRRRSFEIRPFQERRWQWLLSFGLLVFFQAAIACGEEGSRAKPAAAGKEPMVSDVRASSFQNITPGESSLAQLKGSLGEPATQKNTGTQLTMAYQVGSFPKVEMVLNDEVVASIVVHLASPVSPAAAAQELGLTEFVPGQIRGADEEPLGLIFPERGIVFSYAPDTDPPRVAELMLEPISPELFLLRARDPANFDLERKLADLNFALKLVADDGDEKEADWAELHALKAECWLAARDYQRALAAAQKAARLAPDNSHFQLLLCKARLEAGDLEGARKLTDQLLAKEDLPELVRAGAEYQLGELLAADSEPDYRRAMQHHLAAVERATPLASVDDSALRRKAKRILIDAHLAVAGDITYGPWSGKQETGPKWLRSAKELVNDFLEHEAPDESLRLVLLRRALASYIGMQGSVDPAEVAQKALEEGRRLIDQTADPIRKRQLQWELAESLLHATQIQMSRSEVAETLESSELSAKLLEQLLDQQELTPKLRYLAGRIYFHAGAAQALERADHQEAVRWYERALPFLTDSQHSLPPRELGMQGERLVSMGVSYWQTGVREEAIRLTESGLKRMLEAHQARGLEEKALAVPYGNLAAMYRAIGRLPDARAMTEKASRLELERRTGQTRTPTR